VTDQYGNSTTEQVGLAAFPDAIWFFYDKATATITEFIDPYKGTSHEGLLTGTIKRLP